MAGKAMDKLYKFDENGNLVEVLAPTQVGFVGWYAGPEPPEGYLYCDGSAIGRETYSELFAAVGTLYGAGDGVSTFELPDARGIFFRGDGGENSAAMGVQQGDAIRSIYALFTQRPLDIQTSGNRVLSPSNTDGIVGPIETTTSEAGSVIATKSGTGQKFERIRFDSSRDIPTANEVRPINLAMKPCIRYV